MAEDPSVAVGRLRWPLTIVTRQQAQQAAGTGITETAILPQLVHGDVQAVGALTFWGPAGEQIDGPITHRIILRWLDYIGNGDAVLRTTRRRDGSMRTETFRVRRVKEIAGRKRFVLLEVELEAAV